jgi:hypothetical protein
VIAPAVARFMTAMDGPPGGSVRLIGGPLDGRKLVPDEVLGSLLMYRMVDVTGVRAVHYYRVIDGSHPQVAGYWGSRTPHRRGG